MELKKKVGQAWSMTVEVQERQRMKELEYQMR